MPRSFATIDVGTSKICSIIAELDEAGMMRALGVGVVPSKGVQKGVITNIDGATRAIQESARMATSTSGVPIRSAFVTITGRHLRSVNNRGTVGISRRSRLVSPQDVRRAIAESTNVTIPSDRTLVRIAPRYYLLDGQVAVKDPVGMHGFRLDADTHLVTASLSTVRNLIYCVQSAGVVVEDLLPQVIASGEAVLTEEEKEIGVLLADIGGGTTDVGLFRQGGVWHSTSLPVGGYQITRDLSIGLGIPSEVAEEAKIRFGNVTPGYEDEAIRMGEGYNFNYREFHDIISARVTEIFSLVYADLSSHEQEISAPAGLVLTGGTANLPGIDSLARDVLGLPTQVRVPREVSGPADILYDPAYAASVGILLWGAKHAEELGWKPSEIKPPSLREMIMRLFRRR